MRLVEGRRKCKLFDWTLAGKISVQDEGSALRVGAILMLAPFHSRCGREGDGTYFLSPPVVAET